ncbi:hypothetical protein LCGC14_3078770 [marine sediment metagenome]|uniref:DUF551 domain-containing protein n=1 Tax=marine sediment metagenome TaxID=412755 RepID=A0A0F8Z4N2_9ZZZZ
MPYSGGNPTLAEQLEEDERRRFYTEDLLKEAQELGREVDKFQWREIKTAPKDGKPFLALIGGLPYAAKYDKHGRFVWYFHSDRSSGPVYRIHEIDGKRLLEETKPQPPRDYQPTGHFWVNGFSDEPTHWMPFPEPPQ